MRQVLRKTGVFLSGLMVIGFVAAGSVQAVPIASTGSGSAVTSIDAFAGFEVAASLIDNPYIEDGIQFSRTNLTFNNSGCGFAGCFPTFSGFGGGNYMYGTGGGGFFTIESTGGNVFQGLEFQVASGRLLNPTLIQWTTFLNGTQTGNGSLNVPTFGVFGVMDIDGFDELRYTDIGTFSLKSPAFDNVYAQYTGGTPPAIPEPSTMLLFGSGLAALAAWRHKRTRLS